MSGFDGDDAGYGADLRDEAPRGHGEDRLFTSNFVLATLANFVNAFSVQMLVATLPVYVVTQGGTNADAGLVTGVGGMLGNLLAGRVSKVTTGGAGLFGLHGIHAAFGVCAAIQLVVVLLAWATLKEPPAPAGTE